MDLLLLLGLQLRVQLFLTYYFSETFAAIGCAEYYIASGDSKALTDARKYFDIAYDCYTGKIYCPPKTNPETTITKALSPAMIMLSTAQVMRACDTENAERYSKICKDLLSEVIKGGYLKENALLESVTIVITLPLKNKSNWFMNKSITLGKDLPILANLIEI